MSNEPPSASFPDPSQQIEVTPKEVRDFQDQETDFILVDCREQDEYDYCKINGSRLIPLSQFGALATVSLTDRSKPVVVYCHHGMRSLQATNHLRSLGFQQTFSMAGGIERWSAEVDPKVPRY